MAVFPFAAAAAAAGDVSDDTECFGAVFVPLAPTARAAGVAPCCAPPPLAPEAPAALPPRRGGAGAGGWTAGNGRLAGGGGGGGESVDATGWARFGDGEGRGRGGGGGGTSSDGGGDGAARDGLSVDAVSAWAAVGERVVRGTTVPLITTDMVCETRRGRHGKEGAARQEGGGKVWRGRQEKGKGNDKGQGQGYDDGRGVMR